MKVESRNQITPGNTLCAYPFVHKHINTRKQPRLCCVSTRILESDDFNSPEIQEIRNKMIANEFISGCEHCYQSEKNQISLRQKSIIEYSSTLDQIEDITTLTPVWYDLRISNNCNLACQMCGPNASSTIAKQQGINDPYLSYEPDVTINPESTRIYLAGGEPFLIKKFVNVLKQVTNTKCEIVVNTNGTILTKALLTELTRFSNVNITISIDGYDLVNDHIRCGSKWSDITNNIKILQSYDFSLHATTVLQQDNIVDLMNLAVFLTEQKFSKWSITHVTGFPDLLVDSIANAELDQLLQMELVNQNPATVSLLKSLNIIQ